MPHLTKQTKYSLGLKIDSILIEVIEGAITACYVDKTQKLPFITRTIIKLDTLKFFLKIAWETKALDNKKYIALSEPLDEIGRMLGGWRNQNLKQNSPTKAGEK
ncbi:MAG: four helix bundle protein [Candidatus Vogelbacteria bacterium]|nr:four helix bundle protein [Candidatus Vogelbacteria bacterium]